MRTNESTEADRRRVEGAIEWRGPRSYRVRVADGTDPVTSRRRWLYATGKGNQKAAETALRDLLTKRDSGLAVPPKRLTVGEWLDTWLSGRIADGAVGPRAAENYRQFVKKRLMPAVGHIRLQDLRSNHVLAVKTAMSEAGLAPASMRKQLGLLRQALAAAEKSGLIARNPADSVQSPSLAGKSPERRALTEGEIAALLTVTVGTPHDTPIRLALATGLRQSETLGLTWADIDLDAETLLVRQTLQAIGKQFRMLPPKTQKSRRTVDLSKATVRMLRTHRAAQASERLRLGSIWQDHALVFPAPDGQPQYRRTFVRGFHRLVIKAGITEPATVNWHTLRHTAASLWIMKGVDIFTVSRRLGHSNAAFTMNVYGHLLSGQQRAAAEALDHLLAVR